MSDPGRLHVLTDPARGHRAVGQPALRGGADTIQLRDKRRLADEALLDSASELAGLASAHGARMIVNDRVDLAVRCGADGVHLGPTDAAVRQVRLRLGEGRLIGYTINDLAAAERAPRSEIGYYGVGPVRVTASKDRPAPALGLDGLAAIVRALDRPVIAIGGLRAEHVPAVLDAGAFGVAVLSAVASADEPERATAAFRDAIDRWLEGRAA